MMIARFEKRHIIVEAIQFNGLDDYLEIVEWMKKSGDTFALSDEVKFSSPVMLIQTLEGTMVADPGDWIIKGVAGEFYPCKREIFPQLYERVKP